MKIGKTIPSAVSGNCIQSAMQIPSLITNIQQLSLLDADIHTPVGQGQESGDAF